MDPGEKTCPYCAETIKAAAIKCRYCGEMLSLKVEAPAAQVDVADPTNEATSVSHGAGRDMGEQGSERKAIKPKEFVVPGAPAPLKPGGQSSLGDAFGSGLLGLSGGGCLGLALGSALCVAGGLMCLTGIGAIIGVPLAAIGVSLPFTMAGIGGLGGVHGSGYELPQRTQAIIGALLIATVLGLTLWAVYG